MDDTTSTRRPRLVMKKTVTSRQTVPNNYSELLFGTVLGLDTILSIARRGLRVDRFVIHFNLQLSHLIVYLLLAPTTTMILFPFPFFVSQGRFVPTERHGDTVSKLVGTKKRDAHA